MSSFDKWKPGSHCNPILFRHTHELNQSWALKNKLNLRLSSWLVYMFFHLNRHWNNTSYTSRPERVQSLSINLWLFNDCLNTSMNFITCLGSLLNCFLWWSFPPLYHSASICLLVSLDYFCKTWTSWSASLHLQLLQTCSANNCSCLCSSCSFHWFTFGLWSSIILRFFSLVLRFSHAMLILYGYLIYFLNEVGISLWKDFTQRFSSHFSNVSRALRYCLPEYWLSLPTSWGSLQIFHSPLPFFSH